jgi:hypothetical protein
MGNYAITYFNNSAEGKHGEHGVPYYEAAVTAQADLKDVDWLPGGSIARDMAFNLYPKDPYNGHFVLPAASPILITAQPADVETTAGSITEYLSVVAYARALSAGVATEYTCTYQWYSNNSADYTSPTTIVGETSAAYVLDTGLTAGTYYYFCVVTANGITLNSAISTVIVAAAA